MKYRGVVPLSILVVLLLSGCTSAPGGSAEVSPKQTTPEPAGGVIHLTPEEVQASGLESVEVVEKEVAPSLVATARVRTRAEGEAEVFSPFPGRLIGATALPRIGEAVTRGQHIADVEQQFAASEALQVATTVIELQSTIDQAQQEVDLKRTELDRARQLYDGGAIPLKQLQAAQVDLKQAETKLEGARRTKQQYDAAQSGANSKPRRAAILAPISGTVIAADAALGQQVDPSKSLLMIADLRTVWIEAAVHERDLPSLRAVKEAEIVVPGSPENPLKARLVAAGNIVDPQNRTVPVTFSVENRDGLLKIDMFVEAHIPTGAAVNALLIPASAILSEAGSYSVYVETDRGVYQKKSIELGSREGEMVVVRSGLEKGDRVVSVGAQALLGESRKGEIPAEDEDRKVP
jgi:cobalt-zinc-cadmium efflux system membrane fusion protein